jgi:hypothetical protein
VSATIARKLTNSKRRIERRLDKSKLGDCSQPMLTARNIHYEIGDRSRGLAHGGIGAIHALARQIGLIDAIDNRLHLLKLHLPFHESDHVLNFAYNALCDGSEVVNAKYRILRPDFLPRKVPTAHQKSKAATPSQRITPANNSEFTKSGVPYRAVVSLMSFKLSEAKTQESPSSPSPLPASAKLLRKTTLNQAAQKSRRDRFK